MRLFLFIILLLPLVGWGREIKLDKLKTTLIDLEGERLVQITGDYYGERLIIINAQGVHIEAVGEVNIYSTSTEEAIVIRNPEQVTIDGKGWLTINQSISIWEGAKDLTIKGVNIVGAHTGIRINQNKAYQDIRVLYCTFRNISHEGVYIGPHYASDSKLSNVQIIGNTFSSIAWDAIQVGNADNFKIEGNTIHYSGYTDTYGQDYGITINPGSKGHLINNTGKYRLQVLQSTVFIK